MEKQNEPTENESSPELNLKSDIKIPSACPLDSGSHVAHDEEILMLREFRDTAEIPTRRLADKVIELQREVKELKDWQEYARKKYRTLYISSQSDKSRLEETKQKVEDAKQRIAKHLEICPMRKKASQ